jgi:hypothetical protein
MLAKVGLEVSDIRISELINVWKRVQGRLLILKYLNLACIKFDRLYYARMITIYIYIYQLKKKLSSKQVNLNV